MEGASGICLIYQVVCYQKDEDSQEYARTCYEALNKTFLIKNIADGLLKLSDIFH